MSTGTTTFHLDHQRKFLLLAVVVCALGCVFVQRKLLPTLRAWQELHAAQAELASTAELGHEQARLHAQLDRLDRQLNAGRAGADRWSELLARTTAFGHDGGAALHEVSAEHVESTQGLTVRSLPVVLEGRADALLTSADRLERELPGVHLASLDLHVPPAHFGRSRTLLATLTFRTVSP
jgi:hypothetical protein